MNQNNLIRYYMGRHKIELIDHIGRKALIEHLEKGYTGNKEEGYKQVSQGEKDVVLIRHCHKKRRNSNAK